MHDVDKQLGCACNKDTASLLKRYVHKLLRQIGVVSVTKLTDKDLAGALDFIVTKALKHYRIVVYTLLITLILSIVSGGVLLGSIPNPYTEVELLSLCFKVLPVFTLFVSLNTFIGCLIAFVQLTKLLALLKNYYSDTRLDRFCNIEHMLILLIKYVIYTLICYACTYFIKPYLSNYTLRLIANIAMHILDNLICAILVQIAILNIKAYVVYYYLDEA